jgi:polygalacturonase
MMVWCAVGWHTAGANTYNVRDFGAVADRQTNDAAAIQAAVDACSNAGGGTVYLPAGNYLSGMVRLRSNVTVRLDAGATVCASTDPDDYDGGSRGRLFVAQDTEHIAIVGEGTIHGQGTADYGGRWGAPETPAFRTGIVLFERCRHVTIRGVTILYSDSWTVHLKRCETVFIDGVTIINNPRRLNSDGIDPNSCRDVHISNCHIVAGDDCIVLKATEPYPCENVVVTNCTLETTCTALKLGTESHGDFRDIHFTNCTIRNTRVGIGFYLKDGATMERVTFSGISIETSEPLRHDFVYPIFMDIEKRDADSRIGTIRDVIFRDIHIRSGSGMLIQGMPESPIENLTLDNVTVRVDDAHDYSRRVKAIGGRRTTRDDRDTRYARLPAYATFAHVRGLTLDNVRVVIAEEAFRQHERSAVCGHELEDGTIRGVRRWCGRTESSVPGIALHNCRRMIVTDCIAEPGTEAFLKLTGERTADVELTGNSVDRADRPVTHVDEQRVSP